MGTLLLAAICAASLSLETLTQPTDTVAQYVINGEVTLNFDGSQLVGKNIVNYDIVVSKNQKDGTVTKVHMIKTSPDAIKLSGNPVSFRNLPDDYIYVVNDKVVDHTAFMLIMSSLPPEKIKQMTIHKAGSQKARKYSGRDDVKVMELNLKSLITAAEKSVVMYLVDGKTVTEAEANILPTSKIKSINVYKAGNDEAVKVSGNQTTTVMRIETK